MTYTLNQLLEATGVDELAGTPFVKKAAEEQLDFLKIAEKCREAALEERELPERGDLTDRQSLVEKTAAVEIIRKTLSEIRQIEGMSPEVVKTASSKGPDKAAFIKAALEQGHSPEGIAKFLEEGS